ncbi:Prokaryotic N-terminal methylation site [Fimbriimonadaceae bacterium]
MLYDGRQVAIARNLRERAGKRGFSLLELLVVLAILAALAALLYPVFVSTQRSARTTETIAKLRNISIATALYRAEHDGDGNFGTPAEMGLPTFFQMDLIMRRDDNPFFKRSMFEPACDWHGVEGGFTFGYVEEEDNEWMPILQRLRGDFPLVYTTGCTPPREELHNPYMPTLFLGNAVDGHLIRFTTLGNPEFSEYWKDWSP